MRPRDGATRLAVALGLLAALVLGAAAYFLADTQRDQRAADRERYADRAPIASNLVDALFRVAFLGQAATAAERLSGERISTAELDQVLARGGQNRWMVVLDASGRVIGRSSDTPASALPRLARRPAFVRAALGPTGYGLNDVQDGLVETAVAFQTPSGPRVQVTAGPLEVYRTFLNGTLRPLSRVSGSRAFVLDGNGALLGVTVAGGGNPTPSPGLLRLLENADEGSYDGRDTRRYAATSRLAASDWRIVTSVPEDVLYSAQDGIGRWLPWLTLVLAALALVGVGLLLRGLLRATADLRLANVRLAEANRELERSNADLQQFAYVASHDLSEPLRTVAGFSQLLGRRYRGRLDDEADLYIQHMGSGVDRMQQLIDDLLLYSRVGRDRPSEEPVDLDDVLGEVLTDIEPLVAERHARITSDDLPVVRGEHAQLRQVLQNLVVNAVKFTAPDVVPHVHVSAAREGRGDDAAWRITVSDNGIGVPDNQRETIFKMFGRLHPADQYPGTGIGLALVRRIVERHGGRVWVEPAESGGSAFTFTLPAAVPAQPGPRPAKLTA